MYDWLAALLLVGFVLGFGLEFGKLVFRIFIALLVRPKKTPLWPWTEHYD